MNGKGDKRRPDSVSKEQFDKNWNRIFKPKKSRKCRTSPKSKSVLAG